MKDYALLVIPAIDLKDGRCVRLLQGKRDQETVYSDEPVEMALRWQSEGAKYLHLVDLDGAFEGESKNLEAVRGILEVIDIPVELGGGIRSLGSITRILSLGLDRVVLGTAAIYEPEVVEKAIERFGPRRILVAIDAKDRMVAVRGWEEVSKVPAMELTLRMKEIGVERIIYTDISKDGMMVGPNLKATKQLAIESGLKVIASGGVSSVEDIRRIAELEEFGVEGVIVGKALYEGRVGLREAQKVAEEG